MVRKFREMSEIQPTKTQNQPKPLLESIGTYFTSYDLHFQGDSSNGTVWVTKNVSNDFFLWSASS